jgi:hypothetical protein
MTLFCVPPSPPSPLICQNLYTEGQALLQKCSYCCRHVLAAELLFTFHITNYICGSQMA